MADAQKMAIKSMHRCTEKESRDTIALFANRHSRNHANRLHGKCQQSNRSRLQTVSKPNNKERQLYRAERTNTSSNCRHL